jgi:hypothetical protein
MTPTPTAAWSLCPTFIYGHIPGVSDKYGITAKKQIKGELRVFML